MVRWCVVLSDFKYFTQGIGELGHEIPTTVCHQYNGRSVSGKDFSEETFYNFSSILRFQGKCFWCFLLVFSLKGLKYLFAKTQICHDVALKSWEALADESLASHDGICHRTSHSLWYLDSSLASSIFAWWRNVLCWCQDVHHLQGCHGMQRVRLSEGPVEEQADRWIWIHWTGVCSVVERDDTEVHPWYSSVGIQRQLYPWVCVLLVMSCQWDTLQCQHSQGILIVTE